jgi:adenylosuccinate lyase
MIERYTRPEMGHIWTEHTKLEKWLEVELAALEALAHYHYIPKSIPGLVRKRARFSVKRIEKIEEKVQHDVIAFLTNIAEHVGKESRYVHFGLTSSDVLDTGLALQLRDASALIMDDLRTQ